MRKAIRDGTWLALGLGVLVGLVAGPLYGAAPARSKRPVHPAFRPVQDVPGLPRVLLIGDSISIGYTQAVRELLKGKANVHRAPTNCGPTRKGVAELDAWLGSGKWDVIHFNFGLHDLKYVDEKGRRTSPEKGRHLVPLDRYRENLEAIVRRLEKTGARLIWATTTPVPEGAFGRVKGEAARYNAVAAEVMKAHGVAVNDLYAFARPRLKEIQRPRDVHFTPEGSRLLAERVAASILKALEERPAPASRR